MASKVSIFSFTNLVEPRNAGGHGQLSLKASFLVKIARDCKLGRRDERRRPSVVVVAVAVVVIAAAGVVESNKKHRRNNKCRDT